MDIDIHQLAAFPLLTDPSLQVLEATSKMGQNEATSEACATQKHV